MMKININQKLDLINEYWSPKIVGQLNGQHVKLAKLKGEFVWHYHSNEDELFMVIEGELTIEFRDKTVTLNPGEICIIPKGVEHKPVAKKECKI
ncbi:MAG: cupin domain-containing protein, partial [Bacteroidia bacterium]